MIRRGLGAARRATAFVCDDRGEHKGQGLLLDLGGDEGAVVLTCHHVIAQVRPEDLRVRLPLADGTLGSPLEIAYDGRRSRPGRDAVVLRLVGSPAGEPEQESPLLHRLGPDEYDGALEATVLTHLSPDNFSATVRTSTRLEIDAGHGWPEVLKRYRLRAFRLADPSDSRPGISGGVTVCEGGVLGLAHFGRVEGGTHAREVYLVPLSAWAEGWPTLNDIIAPLVDRKLRGAATVRRGPDISVGIGEDVVVAGYRPDVYAGREVDEMARRALNERGGVIVVGRPLSGKSRLAVELLLEYPRSLVVMPRPHSPAPPEGFETSGFSDEEAILLLDDLHRTAKTSQTLAWRRVFEEATGRPCKVVCVTRDGADWRRVETEQRHLLEELGEGTMVFVSRVGEPGRQEGEDLSPDRGWQLAKELGMGAAEFGRRFDGTPGSLLLDLADMRRRYEVLRGEHRGGVSMARLLDSAKLLHRARLPALPYPLVRSVAERVRGVGPVDQEIWDALVRRTREEGFAELDEETRSIRFYAPYLERCVLYEPSREDLEGIAPLVVEAGDVVGLFFLGGFYGEILKDYDKVLSLSDRAIALDPSYVRSWYNKSYSLDKLGRHEEALEAISRALELDPGYSAAYYSKAWALHHLGRHDEALEAFREALRRGEGSYPAVVSMYLDGLSAALAELGYFYEAVLAGLRALSMYPPYKPVAGRLCTLLCAAGEPAYALEVAEEALDTDSEWSEAWFGKGLALEDLGREKEAMEAYNRAISLQRDHPEAWWKKGSLLLHMYERIKVSYGMTKVLGAEYVDALTRQLAQRALDAIDTAIQLGGDVAGNRMNRALALSCLGRYGQALEAIDGTIELEPTNPIVHHNKGYICVRARQYDEALDAFGHATWLAPSFLPAWWPMVLLLGGHFDRREETLAAVNHCLQLVPGDPLFCFARGCILAKMGRSQEARFWLRRAQGHEDVLPLPGISGGQRRSALDFLRTDAP